MTDSTSVVGFEGKYTCVLLKELLARVMCLWGRTTRFCMLSPKGLKPSWLSGGMHNHPRITVVLYKVPHPHKHITTGLLTLYQLNPRTQRTHPQNCGHPATPLYRSPLAPCTSLAALGSR